MEIDNSTYALEVEVMENKLVVVAVPENRSLDIAGNYNLASSSTQVRHCTSFSFILFSLDMTTELPILDRNVCNLMFRECLILNV